MNVRAYSPSVCGEYLDVGDFKDGLTHDFTLKLNVPFCDLLALQAFAELPSTHQQLRTTKKSYRENRLKLMLLTHPPIRTMIASSFK